MSQRTAAWLAWSLCAVCVVLIGLALWLDFLTDLIVTEGPRLGPTMAVLTGVLSLAYPTVGALIASRLPTNPIGWIFCSGTTLHSAALQRSVRRLRAAREFRVSWWGVRGLVLNRGTVPRNSPGRSLPDAAVSRRPSTVSPVANRGVDGGLGSRVDRNLDAFNPDGLNLGNLTVR